MTNGYNLWNLYRGKLDKIPAKKVKMFLERGLYDHDKFKTLNRQEIFHFLDSRNIDYSFYTEPLLHQIICFYLGATRSNFLFSAEMGLGKSKILLDIYRYHKYSGKAKASVILAPYVLNISSWETEIKKHTPDLKYVCSSGSSADMMAAINRQKHDLYVMTYSAFLNMLTHKQKGKTRIIDPDAAHDLLETTNMIIMDEIDYLKSPSSKTFRLIDKLADHFEYRYGATGTPMSRDPHDLWTIFKLLDRGETFSKNIYLFRKAFFNMKYDHYKGVEWVFDKQKTNTFRRISRNKSIRFKTTDCLDLPEVIKTKIYIPMPVDFKQQYNEEMKELLSMNKNALQIQNSFVVMRQLSSGFFTLKSGKDHEDRIKHTLSRNPKLEALMDLISTIDQDHKIVIFNEFKKTGEIIQNTLNKNNIKNVWFYSGTKNKKESLESFLNDKSVRVAIANNTSASVGLNLQVANYVIFFETPVSPKIRMQAEARCIRHGQKKTVFVYDLIMKDSLDARIINALEQGVDLFDRVIDGFRRNLKIESVLYEY